MATVTVVKWYVSFLCMYQALQNWSGLGRTEISAKQTFSVGISLFWCSIRSGSRMTSRTWFEAIPACSALSVCSLQVARRSAQCACVKFDVGVNTYALCGLSD